MLNLIVHKPRDLTRWGDRQFDLTCESVVLRTGPYDNSDTIEIKYLPDTKEFAVVHHGEGDPEIVFSIPEEQP